MVKHSFPPSLQRNLRESQHRFIITGAGGWIGQAFLSILWNMLGPDAFKERVLAYGTQRRVVKLDEDRAVALVPLSDLDQLKSGSYFIFHLAFLTRDKIESMGRDNFIAGNYAITERLLRTIKRLRPEGVFLASSGAVYGRDRKSKERDLYGELKAADEDQFKSLCQALKIKIVITRIFNLAGPYINKLLSYVLGSIICDIFDHESINLRSSHPVIRSYVDVEDVALLALSLLQDRDQESLVFDTCGEQEIEIGDLARRILHVLSDPPLQILRSFDPSLGADRYVGDGALQKRLLAHYGISPYNLNEQIIRTADYIKGLSDQVQ